MTSQISSTPEEDPRGESQIQPRIDELKEAYIEGELTEVEFDELLDAAFTDGPPYQADALLSDRRTMEVPTPADMDEHVVQNRGDYYTIDGNVARVRDTPDWENVVNVTGDNTPTHEVETVAANERELSEEARQKQEELKRGIIGGGERY